MRVLIAEDDMVSRSVWETMLKRGGHEVVAAEDGEAAWEVLRADDSPRTRPCSYSPPDSRPSAAP